MLLAEHPESSEKECFTAAIRYLGNAYDKDVQAHGSGPRFTMYWEPKKRVYQPDVLTPMALHQVLDRLPPSDREVLKHVSEYPTLADAAKAIGWPASTLRVAARKAAENARQIWFDFETAPPLAAGRRRTKTHCAKGHAYTSENTQWVRNHGRLNRRCATCNRERQTAARAAARDRH